MHVLALLQDNCGHAVINSDFAEILAKGSGFSLLPHLTPETDSLQGRWLMDVPQDILDNIAEEGPISAEVPFANTEIPIGYVNIYGDLRPEQILVLGGMVS